MGKNDQGPISQYNSLTDPYLQSYFSRPPIRGHLKHSGLITRKGEVVPEEVWRKRNAAKDKMELATHMIASKIVNQALDIKNLDRAETVRKLEAAYKRELVLKIRGQSAQQNSSLPFLWPKYPTSDSQSGSALRPIGSASDDIRLIDDDHGHQRQNRQRRTRSSAAQRQSSKSKQNRMRFSTRNRPNAVDGEKCELLICYLGNTVNIPYDTQVFSPKDKISVFQQHCGGENLLVHSGYYEPGEKFKFVSKRHKEYPFALTFYINDLYDCRVSTCCEYRHRPETKIGSHFKVAGIEGAYPCIKCMLEKQSSAGSKSKDDQIKPIKQKVSEPQGRVEVEIHEQSGSENDYDNDFDDNGDDWIIEVTTSTGYDSFLGGNDPRVFVSLYDDDDHTEKIWLTKKLAKTSNKSLFRPGQKDEFLIHAPLSLGAIKKIQIGHENKTQGSRWHLNNVVVINKRTGARYVFDCDRWFATDEDDRKTTRILNVGEKKKSNDQDKKSRTEIQVKHSESEGEDDTDRRNGDQRGRLSKKDVITAIKDNQSTSRTDDSRASSARSLGRKDDKKENKPEPRSIADIFKRAIGGNSKQDVRKSSTESSDYFNTNTGKSATVTVKGTKISNNKQNSFSSDDDNSTTVGPQSSNSSDKTHLRAASAVEGKKASKAPTSTTTSNRKSSSDSTNSFNTPLEKGARAPKSTTTSSDKRKSSLSDFDTDDLSSILDFKKKANKETSKAKSPSEKGNVSSASSMSSKSSKKNEESRDTTSAELRRLKDSASSSQSSIRPSLSEYKLDSQNATETSVKPMTKMIIPTVNIIPSSDPENRSSASLSRPSTQSRTSTNKI